METSSATFSFLRGASLSLIFLTIALLAWQRYGMDRVYILDPGHVVMVYRSWHTLSLCCDIQLMFRLNERLPFHYHDTLSYLWRLDCFVQKRQLHLLAQDLHRINITGIHFLHQSYLQVKVIICLQKKVSPPRQTLPFRSPSTTGNRPQSTWSV